MRIVIGNWPNNKGSFASWQDQIRSLSAQARDKQAGSRPTMHARHFYVAAREVSVMEPGSGNSLAGTVSSLFSRSKTRCTHYGPPLIVPGESSSIKLIVSLKDSAV